MGCGPGGMAAALLLHRAGHDVTLFERFVDPRPLGSGLLVQPSGQAVLARLGLLDALRAKAARVDRLHGLAMPSGKRALAMEYRHLGGDVHALGVHRASLFDVLFSAVQASGIDWRGDHALTGFEQDGERVRPLFAGRDAGEPFDLLIDASGARSALAAGEAIKLPYAAVWTTVDRPAGCEIGRAALDQRYSRAVRMAGAMPVGINPASGGEGLALFWSVPAGGETAFREAGIEAFRQHWCALWPGAEPLAQAVQSIDDFTFALYRHRTGNGQPAARVLQIGDAWHCTSPQLGQGANMALIDAAALAEAVQLAADSTSIAAHYLPLRRAHIWLYQAMSRVFTPLYQSDSPLLPVVRDVAVHHFAHWPIMRNLVARIVSGGAFQPRP